MSRQLRALRLLARDVRLAPDALCHSGAMPPLTESTKACEFSPAAPNVIRNLGSWFEAETLVAEAFSRAKIEHVVTVTVPTFSAGHVPQNVR